MKRALSLTLIFVFVAQFLFVNNIVYAETIERYNKELEAYYNFDPDYFPSDGLNDTISRTNNEYYNASFIVYGSPSGNTRTSPISGVGSQKQFLGTDLYGASFDNPAYPWGSWFNGGKPIKDWEFVHMPWTVSDLRNTFGLVNEGGSFSKEKFELSGGRITSLETNMRQGIFEKYVKYTAADNVVGYTGGDISLYTGEATTDARTDSAESAGINKETCANVDDINCIKQANTDMGPTNWEDVVYVLSPPTSFTWGTGWAFIKYSNGTYDYITVPIASYNKISPDIWITSISDDIICQEGYTFDINASCTFTHHAAGSVTSAFGTTTNLPVQYNRSNGSGDYIISDMDYSGGSFTLSEPTSYNISVSARNQAEDGETDQASVTVHTGSITAISSTRQTRFKIYPDTKLDIRIDVNTIARKDGEPIPVSSNRMVYKIEHPGSSESISEDELDAAAPFRAPDKVISDTFSPGDKLKYRIRSDSSALDGIIGGKSYSCSPTYTITFVQDGMGTITQEFLNITGGRIVVDGVEKADTLTSNLRHGLTNLLSSQAFSGWIFKGSGKSTTPTASEAVNVPYTPGLNTQDPVTTSKNPDMYVQWIYEATPSPVPTATPTPTPTPTGGSSATPTPTPTPDPSGIKTPPTLGISSDKASIKAGQSFTITDGCRAMAGASIKSWHVIEYFKPLNSSALQVIVNDSISAPENFFKTYTKTAPGIYYYEVFSATDTNNLKSTMPYVIVPVTVTADPPVPVITAPSTVREGETITVSGLNSKSLDGSPITTYSWTATGTNSTFSGGSNQVVYLNQGTYEITLNVTTESGMTSVSPARHTITVTAPMPDAVITQGGKLKENRVVLLDLNQSTSTASYPIDWSKTKWTVTPVVDTNEQWDFFRVDVYNVEGITPEDVVNNVNIFDDKVIGTILTDNSMLDGYQAIKLLFRFSGEYDITAHIENTKGLTDTASIRITIVDDLPVQSEGISSPSTWIRDPVTGKSLVQIKDLSYSPDGDFIRKRTWYYIYDSDNDGSYLDETPVMFNDGNNADVTVKVTEGVGGYRFKVRSFEGNIP